MFMAKFRVNLVLVIILGAATVLILVVSVVTLLTKVSAHAASSGALVGFLIGLSIRYPQTYLVIPLVDSGGASRWRDVVSPVPRSAFGQECVAGNRTRIGSEFTRYFVFID